MSVTEVGVAGWAWSTHAMAAASLLPAAGSMHVVLVVATADGQQDSDKKEERTNYRTKI